MLKKLSVAFNLLDNYFIGPLMGRPTTAGFWWRREVAQVSTPQQFQHYLDSATPSPFYLMNYESKLSYQNDSADGIVQLPYRDPIGDQINPEAAFIFALALHDDFKLHGKDESKAKFLDYAKYFLETQTEAGDWNYEFDWPGCKAPWTSALAQGRGASVMVRAYLLTQNVDYKNAAIKALSRFEQPISENGYNAIFKPTGTPYYEEYPKRPIVVMNGFMASLIGCWEVSHWLDEPRAQTLFDEGIASLEKMTPYFLVDGWSVYDLNPDNKAHNLNTPRYHKLVGSYFDVLSTLSNSDVLAAQSQEWSARLGFFNEKRALFKKFFWKLRYGIFSA